MKVYVASPFTIGNTAVNVRNSLLAAEELIERGHLPYTPLLTHFWHFMSPHPYEYWMDLDFQWLLECEAVLRLPGESLGADAEVALAEERGIPVYFLIEEVPNE